MNHKAATILCYWPNRHQDEPRCTSKCKPNHVIITSSKQLQHATQFMKESGTWVEDLTSDFHPWRPEFSWNQAEMVFSHVLTMPFLFLKLVPKTLEVWMWGKSYNCKVTALIFLVMGSAAWKSRYSHAQFSREPKNDTWHKWSPTCVKNNVKRHVKVTFHSQESVMYYRGTGLLFIC